jgi:hypothetical protein
MLMGAGVDGVIVIATLRCEVPVLRSPGARAALATLQPQAASPRVVVGANAAGL